MKKWIPELILFFLLMSPRINEAEDRLEDINELKATGEVSGETLFDDSALIQGYARRFSGYSLDVIMEMIKDDTLGSYKMAAAVRVFADEFSDETFNTEKATAEKYLLRRLGHTNSPFVQTEVMYALCRLDRYRYFESMVPALIQKLNHYNTSVNDIAYDHLNKIIERGSNRSREARIVFNTIRKILFLSRNRLVGVTDPEPKLKYKLKLLRWSVKILGIQELEKLPPEVINLM